MQSGKIRTFYLYFFAGIGLFLILLGVLDITHIALKTFVFPEDASVIYTSALDEKDYVIPEEPVSPTHRELAEGEVLTPEEQAAYEELARDYEARHAEWQTKADEINGLRDARLAEIKDIRDTNDRNERNKILATAVAQALVGLLLFGYHWWIIQEEQVNGVAKAAKKV